VPWGGGCGGGGGSGGGGGGGGRRARGDGAAGGGGGAEEGSAAVGPVRFRRVTGDSDASPSGTLRPASPQIPPRPPAPPPAANRFPDGPLGGERPAPLPPGRGAPPGPARPPRRPRREGLGGPRRRAGRHRRRPPRRDPRPADAGPDEGPELRARGRAHHPRQALGGVRGRRETPGYARRRESPADRASPGSRRAPVASSRFGGGHARAPSPRRALRSPPPARPPPAGL